MPQVNLTIIGGTTRLPVYGGRAVENGVLFALSAVIVNGSTKTGRTHVQAGLHNGSPDESHLIAILLDDYVYDGHIPTWTGRVPLELGGGIVGIVRSADGVTVRIVGDVLKRDP